MGPPNSTVCRQNLELILAVCAELGVPLAEEKIAGPTHCLTFLGIEIDTAEGVLRLPEDKLTRLREAVTRWLSRKSCRRRQLESLIGTLQHACRVVKPGRAFLRRMTDLLKTPSATRAHHHIRLNNRFRADLQWWNMFAARWNGVRVLPRSSRPAATVTWDASGSWGCGAWCGNEWFQFQWPLAASQLHISFKELFAGLMSCAIWGRQWRVIRVLWRCDNQAAVQAVNSRSCKDQAMMHLIRCLFFFEAWFSFELTAAYLPVRENMLADELSRDRLSVFLQRAQSASRSPAPVPQALPELLLDRTGWISPPWTTRFVSTVTEE